jgi:hypothetical protein
MDLHLQDRRRAVRWEAEMPKCAGCGKETDLHELDVPICPSCLSERDQIALDGVNTALVTAREIYCKAMADYQRHQARCRDLPKGHPDRIIAAGLEDKAKAAGERYWEVLRALGDAPQEEGG